MLRLAASAVAMFVGITLGVLIGVLPGLGGANGVAILLPLTFTMDPTSAIVMLSCIYWGALFGGAITSVLFNIPGEPWSVATTFDGHPMAQKGQAGEALTAADCILSLGSRLGDTLTAGYELMNPRAQGRRIIHVYPDPDEIGHLWRADPGIAACPRTVLAALAGTEAACATGGTTPLPPAAFPEEMFAALAGALLLVLSPQAQAGDAAPSGAQTRVVVVSAGDTLWSLAQEADPESDPRAAVERIVDLNDLQDSAVRPGQRLVVPQPETAAP